jgi:hypothetical protein
VWAWTADELSALRRLIALGVDAIMTNRPDVLANLLAAERTGLQPVQEQLPASESGH